MFRHVAKCSTAAEIWNILEMHFQYESKARALHFRNLLQSTRKESISIFDYVLKMKEYGDSLTASGRYIGDEELLLYILDGLGPKYDAVVATLTSRSSSTNLQEAQYYLHKHEMRLERQHVPAAFVATVQNSVGSSNVSGCNFRLGVPVE
ncbi:uncharacterized protein LOC116108504 [Pistacia vera]|uniref:uncharacterized protein LOC116108504 n=1 Tax=Pistacia vera TaxID=55513 RepID=UPI001262D238|nr:uncharacterized protein LOC116108504 [Pistacia vera]